MTQSLVKIEWPNGLIEVRRVQWRSYTVEVRRPGENPKVEERHEALVPIEVNGLSVPVPLDLLRYELVDA